VDQRWNVEHGVPINVSAINDLCGDEFLQPPKTLNFQIHVAASPGMKITDIKGKLHAVSPIEPRHALIKAIANAIRRKASDEDHNERDRERNQADFRQNAARPQPERSQNAARAQHAVRTQPERNQSAVRTQKVSSNSADHERNTG